MFNQLYLQIQVLQFAKLMKEKANIYVESVFTNTLCAFISGGKSASELEESLVIPISTSITQADGWLRHNYII